MKTVMLYITASNKQEALKIGSALVKERIAACANVVGSIRSIYWWKGKIEKGAEAVLIAKTKQSLVKKAIAFIRNMHSYDCPCVVALPIVDGNPAFLKWISQETRK
jgi:periplasmic divalent cation tolerance protein